jgi:hypothetical protein
MLQAPDTLKDVVSELPLFWAAAVKTINRESTAIAVY